MRTQIVRLAVALSLLTILGLAPGAEARSRSVPHPRQKGIIGQIIAWIEGEIQIPPG